VNGKDVIGTAVKFLATFLCVSAGCGLAAQEKKSEPVPVNTEMHNVLYRFTGDIAVHVFDLEGSLRPTPNHELAAFDDPPSFLIDIRAAKIAITTDQLAKVMNQHVFAAKDSPLKDLSITTDGNLLKIKGKLHSKGDVPFETDGALSATSDGKVRVQARKLRAVHLPVKGVMDLLGVKIEKLINTDKVRGVRVEGDDLLLDPDQLFPPPQIKGKLTDIKIQGNQLLMIFGMGGLSPTLYKSGGNYMAFRGGRLRFGKLTMDNSDMILIDMDAKDPFDFFLEHYKQQLAAGYSKNTLQDGLRVHMPDYSKLKSAHK
jgi:hypothetical protein